MDSLRLICKNAEAQYGRKIYLIEDCAQCLGGSYKGKKLGSIGDAGCFSFCQDKIITTGGEGGMLTLNDDQAYRRAWCFKDHCKDFDKYNSSLEHTLVNQDNAATATYYSSIGTNWRMTEIQAAIGRIALRKLDDWNLARRKHYAGMLNESFCKIPGLRVPIAPEHVDHPYYKYYCFVDSEELAEDWNRDRIMQAICAEGVVCQFGSTWGIACEDAWCKVEVVTGETWNLRLEKALKNDKILGTSALMFQVHPTLEEEHIKDTIAAVRKVMSAATN